MSTFLVGIEVNLVAAHPLSDSEVAALVSAIEADLRDQRAAPAVSFRRDGDQVVLAVEVVVTDFDVEWDALNEGTMIIRAGLHAADITTDSWVQPSRMRTSVRSIEKA